MVQGGMKCIKYMLFAFNLIFFVAGLGLIIAGAVVQTKFATYFDFFGGSFSAAAILLIMVGVIIFIIGFFGCCGAYKENYCMTMTFAILLGVIFILEIAAGITAYVMRNQVKELVHGKMMDAMNNYGHAEGVTKAWDTVQHDFKCCGVDKYKDWDGKNVTKPNSVPDSCCREDIKNCGRGQLVSPVLIYKNGCITEFVGWTQKNIHIVGGLGIGLAFIQLFGILMACCLARSIKKEYEVV